MILTEKEIKDLPTLDGFKTYRIRFRKAGRLQYISHLDLQRTMSRIVSRSGIPVWYTQGFNPHIKLNFAVPLPVGVESGCELLDLRLDKNIPCEAVLDMLNAKLTNEFCAREVYIPDRPFTDIMWADYCIKIKTEGADFNTAEKILSVLRSDSLVIMKHSKSGDRETDIIPMIKNPMCEYIPDEDIILINVTLATGQTENLNPQALVAALKERTGILCGNVTLERCSIVRKSLLDGDFKRFR